jgi:endonuclease/exonuclease/phosphatase family metal-dependent hydrolase
VGKRVGTIPLVVLCGMVLASADAQIPTFRFVSYNLENYLPMKRQIDGENVDAAPKPESEKQVVVSSIAELQPDILGVAEIGDMTQVEDLRTRLAAAGTVFREVEWVDAADLERHVALFSKFPIVARHSVKDLTYRLGDSELPVQRGFLDVTIQVNPTYQIRCVGVHLKSKREVPEGDETLMRRNEAELLRHHVDAILAEDPNVNLMVYGDFNDTRDEAPVRTIQGKAKTPAHLTSLYLKDRMGMSWTHYWEWAGLYSRIDFIFVNAGLHSEIDFENCRIPWRDDWEQGSDHRPLLATIFSRDR